MPIFIQNVNNKELRISFSSPFSLDQVSKIKTIKGRRWYPTDRYWTVPYTEETVRYLTHVFVEEATFKSFSLAKDSNFTFETEQFSNSKEGCPDFLAPHENRLSDMTNIGDDNLSKFAKETIKSLPYVSDRSSELLLLVRKELELRGYH
ncbi:hypothetical protein [Desulfosporosinus sp. I2]|uniref:hypothetical protein n=1 Tax=Desulfosporosinus sp. I2 TaxID=1617025 RepID=UPI0005F0B750|nr:hypothetical protein [Desulfosporosinus sp. I2]